jgi:hypothetical protein
MRKHLKTVACRSGHATLLGLLLTTRAIADGEGFIDNWRGDVKLEL